MIPGATDPRWGKMIKGEISFDYKRLALKLLLTKLQKKVVKDEALLDESIKELVDFFNNNGERLADDIKIIFG